MTGKGSSPAAKWRPVSSIRVVAIGLVWREDRLLVFDVRRDDGSVKGRRPPGGGVLFGERSAEALEREFAEEFGCRINVHGNPVVLENLYRHHEAAGHEIVFAYNVTLIDGGAANKADRFEIAEDDGSSLWVEWIPVRRFLDGTEILFPEGLLEVVTARRAGLP